MHEKQTGFHGMVLSEGFLETLSLSLSLLQMELTEICRQRRFVFLHDFREK